MSSGHDGALRLVRSGAPSGAPVEGGVADERRWSELYAAYRAAATSENLMDSTIAKHVEAVANLARHAGVGPAGLHRDDVIRWLSNPAWGERTRKNRRTAATQLLRWAYQAARIPRDVVTDLTHIGPTAGPTLPVVTEADLRTPPGALEHPARSWARSVGFPTAPTGRVSPDAVRAWAAAGRPQVSLATGTVGGRWEALLDAFATSQRARGLREQTIRARRDDIERFMRRHPDVDVADVDTEMLITYLANPTWMPNTRKSIRGSLRSLFSWGFASGRLPWDPTVQLHPIRIPHPVPRPAPETMIRDAVLGARPPVRLMIALGALAGLRRGEIAALRVKDITDEGIHVIGKGGNERTVPMHPALAPELDAYRQLRGIESGWLFPNLDNTGHLSENNVGRRISQQMPQGWGAHKLRHRFASRSYASSYDLRSVQELLGHASPSVTAIYVAAPPEALIAAVLGVPPVPGIGAPPTLDSDSQDLQGSAPMSEPSDDETGLDHVSPQTHTASDAVHFRRIVAAEHTGNDEELREAVQAAVAAGDTWSSIAVAIGCTVEQAQRRHGHPDQDES